MKPREELQLFASMMNRRWPFSDGNGRGGGAGDSRSNSCISGIGSLNDISAVASNAISRTRSTPPCSVSSTGINVIAAPPSSTSSPSSHDVMGQISEIVDGLYLCGGRAIKIAKLRELGITTIINVTIELPNLQIDKIEHIKIAIDDSPYANIAVYFDKVSDKIEDVRKNGGKILVHCVAGVSRSASLCIAYLMKHQRMTLRRAYHHVKARRSIIRPNPGFFRQLLQYETNLFGTPSVKMVWNGAAGGSIPDLYEPEYRNTLNFLNKYGSHDRVACKHVHAASCTALSSPFSSSNVKASTPSQRSHHTSTWGAGSRRSHFH